MSGCIGKSMCGAVQFEVPGEPFAMLICHCINCRAQSASPVNGATASERGELTVTKGQEFIKNTIVPKGMNAVGAASAAVTFFLNIPRLI